MNRAITIFTLLLTASMSMRASAQPSGNTLVEPTLVTDASSLEPRKPIRVGITLKVEPGYHVYWKNPGESGQPSEVKWNLPQGFVAGELQWPAPQKFMVPGAIFNFGYEGEVTLLTTITPPSGATGDLPIIADVSWLVCNDDACLPGGKTVTLVLPDAATAKANAKVLDDAMASVPVAAAASADVVQVRSEANAGTRQLKVEWKAAPSRVEFFPVDENVKLKQASISTNKISDPPVSTIELFAAPVNGKSGGTIAGVLSYVTADGHRRGVEVDVPANDTAD